MVSELTSHNACERAMVPACNPHKVSPKKITQNRDQLSPPLAKGGWSASYQPQCGRSGGWSRRNQPQVVEELNQIPRSATRRRLPHQHLLPNHFQHPIKVLIHLCIQDPNNFNSERLDESAPFLIVFPHTDLKMAVSIQLDSELDLRREIIKHKGPTLYCRRNLQPNNWRPLSRDQRITSASGIDLRSWRL